MGIDDPEAWLAEQTDSRKINLWMAFQELEPFGEEWLQSSLIASQAHNSGVAMAAVHGAKGKLVPIDHFVPKRVEEPEPDEKVPTPAEQSAMQRRMLGLR